MNILGKGDIFEANALLFQEFGISRLDLFFLRLRQEQKEANEDTCRFFLR